MADCPACGWQLGVNPGTCEECRKVKPTWLGNSEIGNPLSDGEARAQGFEPGRRAWKLKRSWLCSACFTKWGRLDLDGLCPECFAKPRTTVAFRMPYREGEVPSICRLCKGYLATSPEDGLCDGCGWEKSETTIPFSEWRALQAEAAHKIEMLRWRSA
jgi:hypothetical protein